MTLKLKIKDSTLKLNVKDSNIKIKSVVTIVHQTADAEMYSGSYEITPEVNNDISLSTRNKIMKENLTVLKIPLIEVSNESGGKTLIIGE